MVPIVIGMGSLVILAPLDLSSLTVVFMSSTSIPTENRPISFTVFSSLMTCGDIKEYDVIIN